MREWPDLVELAKAQGGLSLDEMLVFASREAQRMKHENRDLRAALAEAVAGWAHGEHYAIDDSTQTREETRRDPRLLRIGEIMRQFSLDAPEAIVELRERLGVGAEWP